MRPTADRVEADFDAFATDAGDRLRRVLVARHGVDVGSDLTADALAYAWEHWGRVRALANPVGYLYRVAESAGRRHTRWRRPDPYPPERPLGPPDPGDDGLHVALAGLSLDQRTCVVLVHVFGWSYGDVADVLELSVASVRNHLHRGMSNLRAVLERP